MFEPPAAAVYRYEWEITPDGEFRRVSGSGDLLRLHGHEAADLAAAGGWQETIFPEDRAAAEEIMDTLRRGEPWNGRFPIKAKDGRAIVLEIHNEVERCPDGRLLIHGIARDVTHEEDRDRALREREARLRLLLKSIPIVLWSTDRDLRFTWSSGSGLAALGLEENDVLGKDLFEFFGTKDADFTPIAAARRALNGETVTFEVDWSGRHFRCSVEPAFDERGAIVETIGVAVDVTDHAQLEAEARAVGRDVARLAALTRAGMGDESALVIDLGDIHIDLRSQSVIKNDRVIDLTRTEFKLLVELATHAGRPVTRDKLLATVWGYEFVAGSSPLWMTVRRLREKVEDDPRSPHVIETVRGVGYRLTPH
ncbi:MAG: winged helix-turn-helix domain-containing protein [Actinomycetota bacterium]|nr:winged helix-turn-helix domain-containing protein [Actinomycetota bacterium]